MARIKKEFDTEEDITITLASLADGSAVASSEIDNSSNLYKDYKFQMDIKTGPSSVSATGKVFFHVIGAIETGSGRTYPTDLTAGRPLLLPLKADNNATNFQSNEYSAKQGFNGELPKYFKIVAKNETGIALDGTEGNHIKRGYGVWAQVG